MSDDRNVVCPDCDGSGTFDRIGLDPLPSPQACERCGGTGVQVDELTPVCPKCGAEDSVIEENNLVVDMPILGFSLDSKGEVHPDIYGAWDAEYCEPDATGVYRCGECQAEFTDYMPFFRKDTA